jgi:hypothetical protein
MKTSKIIVSLVIMISFGLFFAHDTFAAHKHLLNSHHERVGFVIGLLVTDILIGVYFYVTDSKVSSHQPEHEQSLHNNTSSASNTIITIFEDQISSSGEFVILEW